MKIIIQVTTIILLLSIIACNASRCRCGDLGEGTNPCDSKTSVKTRKCFVPGHKLEKPRLFASPAAIKAARAEKQAEKEALKTILTSSALIPDKHYKLGGSKSSLASSSSSLSSFLGNTDIIEEDFRHAVETLKKLPKCQRVFPILKPNTHKSLSSSSSSQSSSSSSSSLSSGSSKLNILVKPAKPTLPKCTNCGDSVRPLSTCSSHTSSNNANAFAVSNKGGTFKFPDFKGPTSLSTVSQSSSSSNCNLNDFDEAIGSSGMSFADQEKWYRGEKKEVKVPADPVSQSIFLQHILTQTTQKKKATSPMSEAKLNFGPVLRPQNVEQNNKKNEEQEAKLYSIDSPVVELVIKPPQTSCAEAIHEYHEDRLMLDRIQHDLIHQGQKIAESSPSLQPSYSDLGYKPVKKNNNIFVARDTCGSSIDSKKSCTGSCGCSGGSTCTGSCGCNGCGTSCTGACGCKNGANCNGSCGCKGCSNANDSAHLVINTFDTSYEPGTVIDLNSSSNEHIPNYSSESKVYSSKCKNSHY